MPTKTKNDFSAGVGRRKTAVAQTRVVSGTGKYIINGKDAEMPIKLTTMLELVDRSGKLDISIVVRGGGFTGQIDAAILGIARALIDLNPDLRPTLRKGGYLTRDARIVERKKPGLKKARKAPQWAKR
jgi:small subunit ribosomal protein S9